MLHLPSRQSGSTFPITSPNPDTRPSSNLLRQQIHQLFSLVPIAILASLVNGILVTFILLDVIEPTFVLEWLLSIIGINLLWSGLVIAYRRVAKPLANPGRWIALFVAGNMASGLAWGMAAIVLYPASSPSHEMFLTLVLGGMTAGSTALHAAYFPAFLAYSLPTILPLPVQFFAQGDPPHQAIGMMTLIFIAVITVTARKNFLMVKDTLTLETENFRLIQHLEQSRSQTEALNQSLTTEIERRMGIEKELLHHRNHLESLMETRTNELRKSEARYRLVVEKISDVIWVMELDGSRFSYFSPSLERLLGYSGQEATKLSLATILTPASLKKMQEAIERELAYQRSNPHEQARSFLLVLDHRHQNGSRVWAEIRASLLLDEDHQPVGITGVTRDVTERRKFREEKHQLEAQLLRSQKMEAVGNLAGGIAHDFNNFLTTILGNITLTKHLFTSSKQNVIYLERAEQAALHAKNLTHQLLTFSRGGDPIKQPLALYELIRESSELALSGSAIVCQTLASPDLWLIEADPGQIRQVMQNLLMNAIHAMPHGGSITIGAENITLSKPNHKNTLPLPAGPYVKVAVTDQGIGIAEEHLPQIFEPYFTTKPEGHGLGLASSYAIMKKHAGHVSVESQLGVGTTFTLYFPASSNTPKVSEKPHLGICRGQGKILVMDDEESIRIMAGEMLAHCGYDVKLARDGDETVALYKQALETHTPFDLVILDLTVPGKLGGMRTLIHLRELNPGVKALVSSGYSTDPVMAKYASHGFSGVVTKPYSMIDLSQTVHKILWRPSPVMTDQSG